MEELHQLVFVTLIGKPGCHLCDDAREAISAVLESLPAELSARTRSNEFSILDDESLRNRYAEDIPVVLINDVEHSFLRVDADRLRKAIQTITD